MTAKPGMSRSDEIMAQIESRVREFLSRVGRTAVGELDCLELEKEAMAVVKGVGLELMRAVLRAADEEAAEVVVHGERWGSRRVTKGTYTTKLGTVTLLRSGYQRSINLHFARPQSRGRDNLAKLHGDPLKRALGVMT